MFLKQINIRGFKSFARKITINFNSRLTAIIGPNGSGKSNIVDAVRWVLGEQSAKKLRGSKMPDIIFAGSDDHRPLDSARVSLLLDNSDNLLPVDAGEIKITREVNQEGMSDYYINDSSCRLKDIQNLLLDSGLDTDSYAIVGQGQITSIINSRPGKLRELFEEAADILKHKKRKQESEKSLEKTERKLQRIKDLIWELEKQTAPLKKEKEKAIKYRRLKDRLRSLEVSLLLDRWERYSAELKSNQKDEDFLQKQLQEKKERYKIINKRFEEKKNKLNSLRESLEQKKDKLYSLKTKLKEMKNKNELLQEKHHGLDREKKNVSEHRRDLIKKKEQLRQKKDDTSTKIKNIKTYIDTEKERLKKLRQKLHVKENMADEKENSLNSLQKHVMNDGRLSKLKIETQRLAEKINNTRKKLNDLKKKKKNLRNDMDMLEYKISALEKKLITVREDIRSHNTLQQRLEDEYIKIVQKLKKEQQQEKEVKEKANRVTSRLEYIREREEGYEGYYRGVKNILSANEKFSGVIGTVADILLVEKKYETAVEAALGSRLQNIVVKEDKTARKCIKYLKKSNKGRATFLPLNMIRVSELPSEKKLKNNKGFLGTANRLVSCRNNLEKIKNYLLGRILVASDLESAVNISRNINSRYKIVTLDGDIINPGGAISGGSQQKKGSELLGRKRIIEELTEKNKVIKRKLSSIQNRVKEIEDNLSRVKLARKKNTDVIQKLKLKANNLKNYLDNINHRFQEKKQGYEQVTAASKQKNQQLIQLQREKTGAKKEVAAIDSNQSRDKEKISSLEDTLQTLRQDIAKINEKITTNKVKLASRKEKLTNLQERRKELKYQLKQIEIDLKNYLDTFDNLEQKINNIKEKQNNLAEKRSTTEIKLKELENRCFEIKEKISLREAKHQKLKEKTSSFQSKVSELKERLHKLELKQSRLKAKKESTLEHLQENYDLSPGEADSEMRIEIQDYGEIKKKIKELKNSISNLGEVNTGSIREYEELQERINFLYEQEQDLIEARDSLKKVISEIEEKMGEKFHTTYSQVKNEFENIFQKLFSGGKARLKLTEPDELLKTGVEISAQPPGKQLKKLSLMSGGERALTAIALVFAFLQVNPSPIYILDEIDAPLDDANVVRFSRFIREYSRSSQFLIITHRKQMMASVDTIYGVTMEESGISKLLSLQLEEIK